ncbi:hypothetical protein [Pseudomonas saliphila]|uniref:hypothetical protein n=1 Tax=Pseudomonas saliphila TaxID=2586906 RepID=UPI00123ADB9F|nr:hypothetical protein [Pseudomonas saliphila]
MEYQAFSTTSNANLAGITGWEAKHTQAASCHYVTPYSESPVMAVCDVSGTGSAITDIRRGCNW